MQVINNDEKSIVSKSETKCITQKSFVADINSLKLPLFVYGNYKPEINSDGKVKEIEERRYTWVDSKNQSRELYMYNKGRLPRQFESDTWHGLLGLFVKKNAPFFFNNEKHQYEINVNSLEFSWYELCNFMNIEPTGYYIDKLKSAIRILKQTQYFSYENGSWYDKKNSKYIKSVETGMSLINTFKFKTNKKEAPNDDYSVDIDKNIVYFNELTIDNLRYEYMKYLDSEMFFNLIPSGIERGIYSYLEANRYDNSNKTVKYLKRSFDTLKISIPVDFKYPYELKTKMEKPLNHLKKIGYLSDWGFGDELKINGNKEFCVYFCFNITINEMKNLIQKKYLRGNQEEFQFEFTSDSEEDIESKSEYLKLPTKSLVEELVDRNLDRKFANSCVKNKDKWLIIKYILWVDKQAFLNKAIDTGALLGFAFRRDEDLPLGKGYEDINDFIEKEKEKENNESKTEFDNIEKLYDEYISNEIDIFKTTPEYQVIKEVILADMPRIEGLINIGNANNSDVSRFVEFKEKGEDSAHFKELIAKEVRLMKNLMSYEDFVRKNMKKDT